MSSSRINISTRISRTNVRVRSKRLLGIKDQPSTSRRLNHMSYPVHDPQGVFESVPIGEVMNTWGCNILIFVLFYALFISLLLLYYVELLRI